MKELFPRVALLEARFYADLSDKLSQGACSVLERYGAQITSLHVPGVLEIPPLLAMAVDSERYDAYVLLGCVIRGETTHYDSVSVQGIRACMDLAVQKQLAIGQGILTVENYAQALCRADPEQKNKGGAAAQAAMTLFALKKKLGRF